MGKPASVTDPMTATRYYAMIRSLTAEPHWKERYTWEGIFLSLLNGMEVFILEEVIEPERTLVICGSITLPWKINRKNERD
jgi:hypothetical protein